MLFEHGIEDGQLAAAVGFGGGAACAQGASEVTHVAVQKLAKGIKDLCLGSFFAYLINKKAQLPKVVDDALDIDLIASLGIELDFRRERLRYFGSGCGYFLLSLDTLRKVVDAGGEDAQHLIDVVDALLTGYLKECGDGELVFLKVMVFGECVAVLLGKLGEGIFQLFILSDKGMIDGQAILFLEAV